MTRCIGIDPGPTTTALLTLDGNAVTDKAILPNADALQWLRDALMRQECDVAIEFVQSYGHAVGREVFETCLWCGRFAQVAEDAGAKVWLYSRTKVKAYVTGLPRAKDADVRLALMLRCGGAKKGQPLYGVKSHLWAALAVAVYHTDGAKLGGWADYEHASGDANARDLRRS